MVVLVKESLIIIIFHSGSLHQTDLRISYHGLQGEGMYWQTISLFASASAI